jgi:hypothetical protein
MACLWRVTASCAILAAPIASLSSHDTEIMAALDMLLTGN